MTGQSVFSDDEASYTTVAYDAATGDQEWAAQYRDGPGLEDDVAYDLAASPDGYRVFVTGESTASTGSLDYATIAHAAHA